MASLSDKMSTGLGWDTFSKATDLQKRLLFTLGAMIVYRLGTFIPLPGINSVALADIFARQSGGILGMFNMFTGGALSRMTLFALNIMPYISASIIVQLAASVIPSLMALKKEGESGQRKMTQYTRYLTVLITIVQGYGLALGLEAMVSSTGASAVINPGQWFRFTTVVSLLGGTMFIVWLGDQITARGVGNGSSLIITAGIVAGIPMGLAQTFELARAGSLSTFALLFLLVMACALVYFVVFMERAQRRILIQYPKRQMNGRVMNGESSHLPLKINPTGVIPPIFASSLLLLPMTIVNFSAKDGQGADWVVTLSTMLAHGRPLYLALYAALIVFFTFFYTAVVFNPEETADNLKRHGGFIAGIRPGKSTADYLDYVITRLTVLGSVYLAAICCFPEIMIAKYSVPFVLGGTTLLIVVSVTMDFATQIQSHLLAYQYEGLMKKARLKGHLK
ncbi:MAG TPA: preprotein translocase subunit SecY [Alphaproteobacteria bacterium]|nr:preprotein translocase subunit SecY [Alphaproteobacteria bacterium]